MLFICVKLMVNEVFLLQILTIGLLFFFTITFNILTLWYIAGIYLITLGMLLILDDGDIFIGFLWVIDLGVGLIFFIFILHFSNFIFQKSIFNFSNKFLISFTLYLIFLLIFFFFITIYTDNDFNFELNKIWFFLISWYDYYNLFYVRTVTDLNLIRELYFYNNSFEFFIINFLLFYGIVCSILLTFLIKRIFNFFYFSQINNLNLLNEINSNLFIRNQNFIKQQNTFAGTRVWLKNKNFKI